MKIDSLLNDLASARRECREIEKAMKDIALDARRHKFLEHNEYMVFKSVYYDRRTLEETGKKFNITRERTRQILSRVFTKLGEYNADGNTPPFGSRY